MTKTVAIAGVSGYAGAEILRLLLSHPEYVAGNLQLGSVTGNSNAGNTLGSLLPHIPELAHKTVEPTSVSILEGYDVVFMCLPHGHSMELAQQLPDSTVVIDCAADFRLKSQEEWDRYYADSHDYAGSWPYGLPELPGNRTQLRGAHRIAVPGCFPTGASLSLYPAVQAGIVEPDFAVTSITGVSGAGKKASVSMLGAETIGSVKAYGVGGVHRHVPEIIQNLEQVSSGKSVSVSFTPVLAPMTRGILTVASAPLNGAHTEEDVRRVYAEAYADESCVYLLPAGLQPQTKSVAGANVCQVQVAVDERAGRLLVTAAIDNLTKGTAGAAIQCMNLALDFQETAGLPLIGLAP
ncbi:N-acetyl-gamma-glutamyl-phosphate reductase [Corynebacterium renale]|uniref:N-acetyl-gamma-glutamyl-phosphate reductase n=1 Tax=Corynebacterium renale TaxID=1724 RepID=A0A2A9DQX8_9CORY|nr:N-acetyl-gamma-glutamyl-phosphate reductase [Corynebacterium renale]PFG28791.1 N-acetyl-gamma-glutamyl-phosphate reductase [Corynebacterium renale]SQI25761.1 N-acetyl-gamma-glutamyl-phosphate reductase [Corynebacterium renale]